MLTVALTLNLFLMPTRQPNAQTENVKSPNIPTINIILQDATIEDFNSSTKKQIYGIDDLIVTTDNDTITYKNLTIKGHGNSTWYENKKPFQINFSTKTDLLGLGKAKKFILLANAFDSSHIKNATAYYIEKMLQQDYALNGQFINLYFNNEYYGLYFLTEKVELSKSRIALSDQSAILIEHEGLHANTEPNCYKTRHSTCLVIKDINEDDLKQKAMANFLQKLVELELAAERHDYAKIQEIADVDSFAKYYLISDFTLNPDAYMSSYFFYQDGATDKIHVGPGWDFDLAFSYEPNQGVNYGINYFSPYHTGAKKIFSPDQDEDDIISTAGESESLTMYYLIHTPEFQARVKELYNQYLYNNLDELITHINDIADVIDESAVENNSKWDSKDFFESLEAIKQWITERYNYLDSYYK